MSAPLQGIKAFPPNPRGIPAMIFIEDMDAFMSSERPEIAIQRFHENYSKYKLLEQRLTSTVASYNTRIPDIEKNIATLKYLMDKSEEDITASYQLADNVSASADLDLDARKVCLWLGADVMVEYSFEEALSLLTDNLEAAKQHRSRSLEDLDFVRTQVTITEVNTSRVFNYDVKRRRSTTTVQ
ncbi:hypothetical protein RCL1_005870 [Eukaryota sp. TZLM3-RCL]